MTPEPQQPDEIPYREQDHGFADDQPMYPDSWPNMVGHAREIEWSGTDADAREYYADVERRDRARRELGRFGFSGQLPPAA